MEPTLKRKVTVKLTFTDTPPTRPASRSVINRPVTPLNSPQEPVPKPRAKVTSAATTRKPANSVSSVSHSGSVLTSRIHPGASEEPRSRPSSRSPSPAKPRSTLSPSSHHTRASTTTSSKPGALRGNPSIPLLRHRSHTSSSSDLRNVDARPGLLPLHHTLSQSSLQAFSRSSAPSHSPPRSFLDTPVHSDAEEDRPSPSVRVKAKVSNLAKSSGASSPSLITANPISFPSVRPTPTHRRVPSASAISVMGDSTASLAPSRASTPFQAQPQMPPMLYPITTATPAANPHRYATINRTPPQSIPNHHNYQSSSLNGLKCTISQPRPRSLIKVDPATIPLPASSPPASALSLSSRSSVSRSSGRPLFTPDSVETSNTQVSSSDYPSIQLTEFSPGHDMLSKEGSSQGTDTEFDDTEYKVRAAAKSNRKIADLEITTRSLLAINSSLESQKHKQAKEIRELRRKLRESRLTLPPRAYRALDHQDEEDEAEDEEDEEDELSSADKVGRDGDDVYHRVKALLEGLLDSGRRALETKPEELFTGGANLKVLSADEVRNWRDSTGGRSDRTAGPGNDKEESSLGGDLSISSMHLSPSLRSGGISDSEVDNDSEGEDRIFGAPNPSHPPILITDID